MSALPAPQNVAEVENLIKRLYEPGPAAVIVQINDQLQKLQLSQDGWKLADALMASNDANVRFFGALTFTVKLNNDGSVPDPELSRWPTLDTETAQTVQMRLIYWLVRLVGQGEGGLVCRKLCSTLTTYFIQSPLLWDSPLLHLTMCFHQGDVIALTEVEVENPEATMSRLLPTLNSLQLIVLLWFTGTLAEEVGRVDANAQAHAHLHAQMEYGVKNASALMSWSFQRGETTTPGASVKAEALQTFLTWINYAQPVWPRKPEALQNLRDLIEPAAECLLDKELFQEALDIFRDILESYTTFFASEHMALLARIIYDHVRPALLQALFDRESDGQHVLYGQFVIAFGCANIQQVIEEPNNAFGSQAIVQLHLDIIGAEGFPGDDDQLSIQSIEFWNTYIEYVNDVLFSRDSDDPEPAWLPQAKSVLKQTFQMLWKKMLTPPGDVAQEWGDEEKEGFKEFRIDTADLFLSIFVLLGKDMLQQLVDLAMQSLDAKHWQAVEASLFCLNTLADNILEDPTNEQEIQRVFSSSLFREIANFSVTLPSQTRRTAIDLLGSYGPYIERNTEFLPDALRFLFASLETSTLSNASAKSIASLCSTCRASLTNELPGFLTQYQRFLDSNTSDPYTKEKVIGAIAAIIQAMSPENTKAEPLLALLSFVESDIERAKQYAASGDDEMVETMGVTALECLASIGKGMQAPDDVSIDIYDDDDERDSKSESYWTSEQGRAIQRRIVGCFSALELVGSYSAAIDAVCHVLRSGYTETVAGPFVLPPSVTVSFLQQCTTSTPQLESVLSTACMLIAQHSRHDSQRIDAEVRLIFERVISFVHGLGQSKADPTLATACIDVCNRLMQYDPGILFSEIEWSLLDFILSAITAPDGLPKKSACEFSAKLFSTKHLKQNTAARTFDIQQRVDEVAAAYGSKFAHCLMLQIGGMAARSELDFLCDPLKAMLLHQINARAWLQQEVVNAGFSNASISTDDKARFLQQLFSVRSDGKKIKELVKGFWAACRGTVLRY